MPVLEILECGLYHEKNGIYACQNVVETCWKHGDMILCSPLVFLFFNLIKTAAKFMRTESVKCSSACGIGQVESQARAYYVTQFTYKS